MEIIFNLICLDSFDHMLQTKHLDETKQQLINKQFISLGLGFILLVICFVLFPIDSYYVSFFFILRAFIFGGMLAVIKNRFKFVWFFLAIFFLLAIYYLQADVFHSFKLIFTFKWFVDDLATGKMLLCVTSFYCLASGLINLLNNDQIILKLSVIFFATMAIPMFLLFACALVGFDGLGMGLIFAFLLIPFILFMFVVGGYWILSGDIKIERVVNDGI